MEGIRYEVVLLRLELANAFSNLLVLSGMVDDFDSWGGVAVRVEGLDSKYE